VASAEEAPSTAVAKRVVRSVKINANGDPVWPMSAYAEAMDRVDVASTAAAAIAAEVPVEESAAVTVAAVEPLALTESAPEPQVAAEPDKHLARVTGGPTNVRSGPARSHKRLFVLAEGTEVEPLAATSGWVRIVDDEGRAGWIFGEFLEGLDLASLPAPPPEDVEVAAVAPEPEPAPARAEPAPQRAASGDTRTVKGQGVNVRSGPSSSNGKLFALTGGTEVTVVDTQRGWLKITDPKGRTGWAYSSYLN
jgi:SH3-like domain-containing protein